MIDLKKSQADLFVWAKRNFGEPNDPNGSLNTVNEVLGMAEEMGELAHAVLKRQQKIREAADGSDMKEEIADAFADVVIFGLNAMSCEGIDAEQVLKEVIDKVLRRDWVNDPEGLNA